MAHGIRKYKVLLLLLLLLLLSRFSCVQLCVTPQTAAYQAPPSLGFSRQEHWSGLPFPSPMHESESEVAQSCLTLRDTMDCSLPGSSVHGSFQARVLEWVASAFSNMLPSVAKIKNNFFFKLKNYTIYCTFWILSYVPCNTPKRNKLQKITLKLPLNTV